MTTNNIHLVDSGREFASKIDIHTAIIDIVRNMADLTEALAAEIKRCEALAAENAALKHAMSVTLEHVSVMDTGQAGVAAMIINDALHNSETPATDAFLAEVRASAIPEGYAIVPQQVFLDPSDIESICSQCGDGHESGYGDFTDGLLWVGNIQRDDGSIVHGLHISSADYSEEGGVTVCDFAAQLRGNSNGGAL